MNKVYEDRSAVLDKLVTAGIIKNYELKTTINEDYEKQTLKLIFKLGEVLVVESSCYEADASDPLDFRTA